MLERALDQRTLVDGVTSVLREAVLDGEYLPGETLRLRDLARRLEVSVMPVREALQQLANDGLIEVSAHRGARVAPLRIEDLEDLYHFRMAIEPEALRVAVGRLGGADYDRLERVLEMWDESMSDEQYRRIHREFHFGIYALDQSPWCQRVIPRLWEASERYRRWAIRRRGIPESRWNEHEPILRMMRANRCDAASLALREHLQTTLTMLSRHVPHTDEYREAKR